MINVETFWDRAAIGEFPRDYVRITRLAVDFELTIPVLVQSSQPWMAGFWAA